MLFAKFCNFVKILFMHHLSSSRLDSVKNKKNFHGIVKTMKGMQKVFIVVNKLERNMQLFNLCVLTAPRTTPSTHSLQLLAVCDHHTTSCLRGMRGSL